MSLRHDIAVYFGISDHEPCLPEPRRRPGPAALRALQHGLPIVALFVAWAQLEDVGAVIRIAGTLAALVLTVAVVDRAISAVRPRRPDDRAQSASSR